MLCVPPASALTTAVATPFVTVPVPINVAPSRNVTVPVAVVEETVAVSVVALPNTIIAGLALTPVVVAARFTVTVIAELVDAEKFVSPEYTAVMLCVPPARLVALKLATPLAIVPVPRVLLPSLNVTVPVPAVFASVAVKIVALPYEIVVGFALTLTASLAVFTCTVIALLADPVKFASPLYTAVIEWLPPISAVALNIAVPLLTVPVPSVAAPSLNVTVPVAPAVTVAVSNVAPP